MGTRHLPSVLFVMHLHSLLLLLLLLFLQAILKIEGQQQSKLETHKARPVENVSQRTNRYLAPKSKKKRDQKLQTLNLKWRRLNRKRKHQRKRSAQKKKVEKLDKKRTKLINGVLGYQRKSRNGAASNDGSLIKWENVRGYFQWRRKKRQVGRSRPLECCKKVEVTSVGEAAEKQWDRLGLYYASGQILNGRMVYQNENRTQSIFYVLGEFDGWLLGPKPGVNYGGIKNFHDGKCVHSSNSYVFKKWGFYDGPKDTEDPEEAYPYWKYNDPTLKVKCISKTVQVFSKRVPDPSRGPMLRSIYSTAIPVLKDSCGDPLATGKLNMEAWIIKAECAGTCGRSGIQLTMDKGRADLLIVVTRADLDLSNYCFNCNSYWAGRLLSGERANWGTAGPGMEFRMYVVIVGYDDYIGLTMEIDSHNLINASAHKLK